MVLKIELPDFRLLLQCGGNTGECTFQITYIIPKLYNEIHYIWICFTERKSHDIQDVL